MLDLKFIRENSDKVRKALHDRQLSLDLDGLLKLDEERRLILVRLDELRNKKNLANDQISKAIKEKQNPQEIIKNMKAIAEEIDGLEGELKEAEARLNILLMAIPNIPHSSIPVGGPAAKQVAREWGRVKKFDFPARTHMELAEHLDIIDLPRAAKITGSNFVLFKGAGARLERALFNFMLDLHTTKHGYKEIFPPFLVNRASMTGTGQLPKMEEDMYRLKDDDLFLIPTAEVPVTNLHRDEILNEEDLPIYYAAYTACFRKEAGSYGKDTKGMIRVHQFDKVEMVKFVKPETSYDELEKLVGDAEEVLQLLGLTYRVVVLPTGDISFAASKCYDLEAYAPGMDAWLEVSSCSNFEDFQARRANIKFKRANGQILRQVQDASPKDTERSRSAGKRATEYIHTLNGSGVALARTVVAILENYQQKDGAIVIPEVLRPYMGGREKIE